MGFNIPGRRPSVTVIDFNVTIPVLGDKPDASYYPTLAPGAQVIGGGKVFETQILLIGIHHIVVLATPIVQ